MIVADTDILIDALQGRPAVRALVAELLRARRIATTAISRIELGTGVAAVGDRKQVEDLLAAMPILPVDADASALAAERGAALRRAGVAIPLVDLAIGGVCLARGFPLLTRNQTHFRRIAGLRLVDVSDRTLRSSPTRGPRSPSLHPSQHRIVARILGRPHA